jgi:hypothetical protein
VVLEIFQHHSCFSRPHDRLRRDNMTTARIDIGDTVQTLMPAEKRKCMLLKKGSIGRVCDYLGDTREGRRVLAVRRQVAVTALRS